MHLVEMGIPPYAKMTNIELAKHNPTSQFSSTPAMNAMKKSIYKDH